MFTSSSTPWASGIHEQRPCIPRRGLPSPGVDELSTLVLCELRTTRPGQKETRSIHGLQGVQLVSNHLSLLKALRIQFLVCAECLKWRLQCSKLLKDTCLTRCQEQFQALSAEQEFSQDFPARAKLYSSCLRGHASSSLLFAPAPAPDPR